MKKLLIILSCILLPVLFINGSASAQTTTEKEICSFVAQNKNVTAAKCLVYKQNCVVAIKTEKFTSKTQYEQFKEELQRNICEKFDISNVIVTRSPKAMHTIDELGMLDESAREQAIEKLIEQLLQPKPHCPSIQPR